MNRYLNEHDLTAVADALADVVIARQLSAKAVLTGVHAFLMAFQTAGRGDAGELAQELFQMSEYFYEISEQRKGPAITEPEWNH
jgi:hypothetical protein